jgi:RNA polymerase sigma factor (TIGR02999 family)
MSRVSGSVKISEIVLTEREEICNLLSCEQEIVFPSNTPMHSPPITELLAKWQTGDQEAFAELAKLVEAKLRRLARRSMFCERPGHTLQTTALINEAYLRLIGQKEVDFQSRTHFYRIAAWKMRQVLVDHARARLSAKRGGGVVKISLDDESICPDALELQIRDPELIALNDALEQLAKVSLLQYQIVEMRYFGGLTIEETAHALKIATGTVKRHWTIARAWLHRELVKTEEDTDS